MHPLSPAAILGSDHLGPQLQVEQLTRQVGDLDWWELGIWSTGSCGWDTTGTWVCTSWSGWITTTSHDRIHPKWWFMWGIGPPTHLTSGWWSIIVHLLVRFFFFQSLVRGAELSFQQASGEGSRLDAVLERPGQLWEPAGDCSGRRLSLGPPAGCPFSPSFLVVDCRRTGYQLILTSLLEDLGARIKGGTWNCCRNSDRNTDPKSEQGSDIFLWAMLEEVSASWLIGRWLPSWFSSDQGIQPAPPCARN